MNPLICLFFIMLKSPVKRKNHFNSYSYKKDMIPFSVLDGERIKPPESESELVVDSRHLFKSKELTLEDEAKEYMDRYRKAERAIVVNFYTGGGPYRKGVLDSIYRGFNPMNP